MTTVRQTLLHWLVLLGVPAALPLGAVGTLAWRALAVAVDIWSRSGA